MTDTDPDPNGAPELYMEILSSIAELGRADAAARAFCEQHGVSEDATHDLCLCLDELIANTMRHGYGGTEGPITLRLSLADGVLTLELRDRALPFSPLEAPAPGLDLPIEERPIGGLGVHIVRELMTSMDYEWDAGENCVTLTLQLQDGPGGTTPRARE